ncbi:unnamed protein product [Rotaria magnacalcarata]|uniref:Uncharacterized protein n=1 Tax=Rotaria magnacalcarata TaxID=392030 RepID=A0A816YGG4_9BILA|nr:unnamed protein product [Rotaria magnacalcarata]CAF3984891.1 unnamed protein product [Rotaria magnacalcarata]
METNIDDLSFHLSALKTTSNEISILDNREPISTFSLPSMSSCPMAADGSNHLLIYHHHHALLLFHLPKFELLFSISLIPFIENPISDICYYSTLNCFLVSSSNTLYSLSSSRQIDILHKFSNTIWSITHTSNYIFICYLFGFQLNNWKSILTTELY